MSAKENLQKVLNGEIPKKVPHLEEWRKIQSYRFPNPLAYWRFDIPNIEETIKNVKAKGKYITAYAGHLYLSGFKVSPKRTEAVTVLTDFRLVRFWPV